MAKVLRCSSCGAGLRNEGGQPNVVCEYCNSFVRVADDKPQFDVTAVLTQIMGVWSETREEKSSGVDLSKEYDFVMKLMENHKYVDAQERLDKILDFDETQSRAWFYKSLLPVLENENVAFKGKYVNIVKLSQVTNRSVISTYLSRCGLKPWQHKQFMEYYRKTDFLFEQHMRDLNRAIEHAQTETLINFLLEHKEKRIKWQKQKLRKRNLATFGWIFLMFAVIAGCCVAVWFLVLKDILT
jgi:hypothetical protein